MASDVSVGNDLFRGLNKTFKTVKISLRLASLVFFKNPTDGLLIICLAEQLASLIGKECFMKCSLNNRLSYRHFKDLQGFISRCISVCDSPLLNKSTRSRLSLHSQYTALFAPENFGRKCWLKRHKQV